MTTAEGAVENGTKSVKAFGEETEKQMKTASSTAQSFAQQLGGGIKDASKQIGEFGKSMTILTAPITAFGAKGTQSFLEVDKTMQLANKTMGNTAEQAGMLQSAMEQAASNSTFGMQDAAKASLNFARAGLNAEQAAAALAPAMNLAAGEGGNLDTVSAGLTATINGFGDSFENAGHYSDVFAAACNNSALDVDGLASSMNVAAPVFSAAGKSVEDAALYMGVTGPVNRDRRRGPYSIGDVQILTPDDLYYPGRIEGRRRHEHPLLIDEMDLVIEKLCRREVVGYSVTHPDPEWGDAFSFPTRGQDGEP